VYPGTNDIKIRRGGDQMIRPEEYQTMVVAKNARTLEIEIEKLKEENRILRAENHGLKEDNKALAADLSGRSI
jgi:hypothetical protein